MSIVNPLTNRSIKVGGRTHKKLLKTLVTIEEVLEEDAMSQTGGAIGKLVGGLIKTAHTKGKAAARNKKNQKNFFESLKQKSQTLDEPKVGAGGGDDIVIPKSKYHLISSSLPPNPEHHSWYHHHAPFSQNFGDYVCLKKSTLKQLGLFLRDSLTTDV